MKSVFKRVYLAARGMLLAALFHSPVSAGFRRAQVAALLAIRIDRIGDLVMSQPALQALKSLFPQARISLLVRPALQGLAVRLPGVDEVLCYRGWFDFLRLIRTRRYDLAVDLLRDYTLKTALLAWCSHAPLRCGFAIEGRQAFFNLPVQPRADKRSMAGHELDLVRGLARYCAGEQLLETLSCRPLLGVSEREKSLAVSLLQRSGVDTARMIIGCAPGAFYPSQRWPAGHFADLADRLCRRFDAGIVLIGSLDEQPLLKEVARAMRCCPVVLCGLALDELVAVISCFRLLLCNNSGPLHIASAVSVPTVSTLGPTDAVLWTPLGRHQRVLSCDCVCQPCSKAACRDHRCLKNISVDAMEQAALSLMQESAG